MGAWSSARKRVFPISSTGDVKFNRTPRRTKDEADQISAPEFEISVRNIGVILLSLEVTTQRCEREINKQSKDWVQLFKRVVFCCLY